MKKHFIYWIKAICFTWKYKGKGQRGRLIEFCKFIILYLLVPLLSGIRIINLNNQLPLINNLREEIQILILVIAFDIEVFVLRVIFVSPPEIHEEQEEKIETLEGSFISPNLIFSVLSLGEAIKNKKRYASIVVENQEDFEIEDFYGVNEVIYSQPPRLLEWEDFTRFINPSGFPIEIDGKTDKDKITLANKGGRARFNIAEQGYKEIIFLNHNDPRPIQYGDEFKIKIIFRGKAQDKLIKPIEKTYRLYCAYRDDVEKEDIFIVDFEEY